MPRAKGGFKTRQRRNRVLKRAEGFWGKRKNCFRSAQEAVDRALAYSYRDRRNRKREFRNLWIIRINAAARIASGKYIFKTDAHCMFAKGFDEVLQADMEDNWVVMPRFYVLDAEHWQYYTRSPIFMTLRTSTTAERFAEFLGGAAAMDQHALEAPLDRNLPATLALMAFWNACCASW